MAEALNLFRDYQRHEAKSKSSFGDKLIADFHDAQLFVVPVNGRILDNNGKSLDHTLRLPFPKIIIELETEITGDYGTENIVDGEDDTPFTSGNTFYRHIVFAEEVGDEIHVQSVSKFRPDGPYKNTWGTNPFKMKVKRDLQSTGVFSATIIPTHKRALEMESIQNGKANYQDIGLTLLKPAFAVVAELLEALSCTNVKAEKKPNKKRLAGRRPGELPYDDYHELVVYASKSHSSTSESLEPTGVKRREHLRRGHIRTYQSGLKIWVQAHVVNAGSQGKIEKHYKVKK